MDVANPLRDNTPTATYLWPEAMDIVRRVLQNSRIVTLYLCAPDVNTACR